MDLFGQYKDVISSFFREEENIRTYLPDYLDMDTRQIQRICHGEVFPFCPEDTERTPALGLMVFDYRNRMWDNKAFTHWFPMNGGKLSTADFGKML